MKHRLESSEITSKIEVFDSSVPCATCIIKCICSTFCRSLIDMVRGWPHKHFQKYSYWYHETLSKAIKEVEDGSK